MINFGKSGGSGSDGGGSGSGWKIGASTSLLSRLHFFTMVYKKLGVFSVSTIVGLLKEARTKSL